MNQADFVPDCYMHVPDYHLDPRIRRDDQVAGSR